MPSPNPVLRPQRQHHLDVDDMIDSTVDSSSGYAYNTRSRSSGPGEAAALQNDEGPVQSSHYEDSSDDDEQVNEVNVRPQYHRHNSSNNGESGISTSGQVDEGQFRLVPNNLEDERFNQFNPPRSQPEPSASSSTSTSTSSTSRASASQNNNNNNNEANSVVLIPSSATNSNANAPSNTVSAVASAASLFCEPGPSRPRNNGLASQPSPGSSNLAGPSGSNNGASNSRNNGLDYEIDARQDLVHFPLDNFPDPAPGDYDPSLSSSFPPMDSHPVDLEDIQVQNFEPGVAEPSASVSSASMSKYINNNDMKDDMVASGSLGNISLAFSGLPGSKSSSSANDTAEAKAASSSTSNNSSYHSSILESMTGPLSKRLRTLHSLQQQQSTTSSGSSSGMAPHNPPSGSASESIEAPPKAGPSSYKVNGEGKKSKNNNEAEAASTSKKSSSNSSPKNASGSSNNSTRAAAGSSSAPRQHFDPEQDDDGSAASGSSSSNVIQTFSVTIETNGGINAIKPKKFFQQKSANDELFDVIHPLNDEKSNSLALNRTRRKIKKKELIYCEQCRMDYDSECPLHQPVLMHIVDQSIMTRAQASLPSGYLALRNTDTHTGTYKM